MKFLVNGAISSTHVHASVCFSHPAKIDTPPGVGFCHWTLHEQQSDSPSGDTQLRRLGASGPDDARSDGAHVAGGGERQGEQDLAARISYRYACMYDTGSRPNDVLRSTAADKV